MDIWTRIAENKIREAIEQGQLDHLPGSGKPLDLSRDPFEDPLAPTFRRILRDNGSTHPLIEAKRALEEELERSRHELRVAWKARGRGAPEGVWIEAAARFRMRCAELNRRIRSNNLGVPLMNFEVRMVDADAEIARIERGAADDR